MCIPAPNPDRMEKKGLQHNHAPLRGAFSLFLGLSSESIILQQFKKKIKGEGNFSGPKGKDGFNLIACIYFSGKQ